MTTNRTYTNSTVNIADLGRNPRAVIQEAQATPMEIRDESGTVAYLISADVFDAITEMLEDADLAEMVRSRRGGPSRKVTLDDL